MSRVVRDLIGQRYGRLLVTARGPHHKSGAVWRCTCDCGKTRTVRSYALVSGETRSCGCLREEPKPRPKHRNVDEVIAEVFRDPLGRLAWYAAEALKDAA